MMRPNKSAARTPGVDPNRQGAEAVEGVRNCGVEPGGRVGVPVFGYDDCFLG